MDAQKLLEAVKSYERPKELHPIAVRAYDLYVAAGRKITDRVFETLDSELAPLRSARRLDELRVLADALYSLGTFIWFLNERADNEQAADRISDLVRTCSDVYARHVEILNETVQDRAEDGSLPFKRFSGSRRVRRAPRPDDPVPQGTVPAVTLKPVARRPHFVRSKGPAQAR